MVLRESLVDADIPRRDKMKEAIMGGWQRSFKELKSELAVSLNLLLLAILLTSVHSALLGKSVLLRMPGPTRIWLRIWR